VRHVRLRVVSRVEQVDEVERRLRAGGICLAQTLPAWREMVPAFTRWLVVPRRYGAPSCQPAFKGDATAPQETVPGEECEPGLCC
jgi:hypothetical protein